MREHLIQAFKKKKLDQFPVVKERRVPFGGAIKHSEVVDIYCDCHMPCDGSSGGDMIQCSMSCDGSSGGDMIQCSMSCDGSSGGDMIQCSMSCDGSSGGDMIQCSMCKSWFHCTCINLSSVANYKNRKWYCVKCNVLMS